MIGMFMNEITVRDKYDRLFDRKAFIQRTTNDVNKGDKKLSAQNDNLDTIDKVCDMTNALKYFYDMDSLNVLNKIHEELRIIYNV